jgi:hypothetical protein
MNSIAKADFCILAKPEIRGLRNAAVLAQIGALVVLLKRIARSIVKVILAFRKKTQNNKSPPRRSYNTGPKVPTFLLNLPQRE